MLMMGQGSNPAGVDFFFFSFFSFFFSLLSCLQCRERVERGSGMMFVLGLGIILEGGSMEAGNFF